MVKFELIRDNINLIAINQTNDINRSKNWFENGIKLLKLYCNGLRDVLLSTIKNCFRLKGWVSFII